MVTLITIIFPLLSFTPTKNFYIYQMWLPCILEKTIFKIILVGQQIQVRKGNWIHSVIIASIPLRCHIRESYNSCHKKLKDSYKLPNLLEMKGRDR